jgi:polysaccharide deacetylase family protein (PEP-CTERM system associated)
MMPSLLHQPVPLNAFTVDLEEWFQGLTSTNRQPERWEGFESRVVYATHLLLDILRQYGVRATFFTLGHVADRQPALMETICAEGHELGIHGYYHRFVSRMTPAEFDQEVGHSLEAVMRVSGVVPQGHRAPYFSVNATTPWAFEVLARHGLRYDSSVFPTRNMLYGFPGAPRLPYQVAEGALWELPASTVRWAGKLWPMSGGFYVRALPYAVTRWALRRLQQAGEPAVLYIHPWELDLGQRYRQVTARERLTHYHGRRGLATKLHRLFNDFRFGPMRDLVERLEGEAPPAPAQTPVMVYG